MGIILFDGANRNRLFPLNLTKAIADLRLGIVTIAERWALQTQLPVFVHTEAYLQALYPLPDDGIYTWVDAAVITDEILLNPILNISVGEALADENGLIAIKTNLPFANFDSQQALVIAQKVVLVEKAKRLTHPWELMLWNDLMIREDFQLLTKGKISEPIPPSNQVINPNHVFIEKGADVQFASLNAATGPIYIGKNATIMEGSHIRGPFALGEGSALKMGSKVYGATTLGPMCMGGGEIKNVVMQGYSNKAHDGYLGDSVIGAWCNFGAGTSNSNIKNTGGDVHMYSFAANSFVSAGQKCGLVMGDYSRVAINSCINTGSVIGVCCNVFGKGLLPKLIANFTWGDGETKYVFEKALADIENWKKMKHQSLKNEEALVLKHIFGL